MADQFRPHVAIIDLHLLDQYGERSGLGLLWHLRWARRILYSAYLTPAATREALQHYGVTDWVGKDEPPQRLLGMVAEATQRSCAGHRNLAIHRPAAWTSQRIAGTLFDTGSAVPPEIVDDIFAQLFPDSRQLTLETVSGEVTAPLPVSRGRTVVLKVQPDDLEPVVVKLAPALQIREEAKHYRDYIQDRLPGRFYAQLQRTVEFWDLGGATYAFLDSSLQALPSFAAFYRKETDARAILRPLHHLFKEVWGKYYAQPFSDRSVSLFQVYDEALHLMQRLKKITNLEEEWVLPGLPIPLLNPAPWVLRHADEVLSLDARMAVTHGDLHGDNLFVDDEHAWVIDFERSGPGHILRDFIELEVDILTRLVSLQQSDLARFHQLAVALAEFPESSAPTHPPPLPLEDPEVCKALHVIAGLRNLAYEITHFADPREYLWGLLLDALFVATLVSEESPQRERALLLGAVLCDRLQHWGKEWSLPDRLPMS